MSVKKLILYGAGLIGKEMAIQLDFAEIKIECFCDSDLKKCGGNYSGYPVKSIDEIKCCYPKGSYSILITTIEETAENIKEELIQKGIFSKNDFYDEKSDSLGIMKFFISRNISFSIPQELEQNFRYLNEKNELLMKKGLLSRYFNVDAYDDLSSDSIRNNFSKQLYGRLGNHRKKFVPWLNSIHRLQGASILEIGCGTGASTVALCEQGADVTAIDVNKNAMEAAKIRLDLYDLTANLMLINAANIMEELLGKRFDFIIFFASLEHMVFQERIKALKAAFQMLNPNGHVVLIDTPNRLWYIDNHTSWEPFYNWLPNDVAMEYSKFTPRESFNRGFDTSSAEGVLKFARWGRGVSYHEFEIALCGRNRVQVVSSLNSFQNVPDSIYKRMLRIIGPEGIHEGFYEAWLDIALKNITED